MWQDYVVEETKKKFAKPAPVTPPAGNFVVKNIFDTEECDEDPIKVYLVNKDTGEIILEGDTYHNHIEDRIEGFFSALDFFEYPYNLSEENEKGTD